MNDLKNAEDHIAYLHKEMARSSQELYELKESLREMTLQKERYKQQLQADRNSFKVIAIVLFLIVLFVTFKSDEFVVYPYDSDVVHEKSSWWGLKKDSIRLEWRQTSDYDFPGWMTKNSRGKWYLYIVEGDFESPDYIDSIRY